MSTLYFNFFGYFVLGIIDLFRCFFFCLFFCVKVCQIFLIRVVDSLPFRAKTIKVQLLIPSTAIPTRKNRFSSDHRSKTR